MILIGTLAHVAIGLALSFFFHPVAIALMFWFKEVGEAKYQIKGSIKTLKKNLEMLAFTVKPKILPQWLAPGIAAALLQWLL